MAKYDIFISYRRDGGYDTAKHLYDLLTRDGYKVSFDIDTLRNGDFDTSLLKRIDECKDFILVIDAHAFDRTLDPNFNPQKDWLRQELSYALKKNKNIIPIFLNGITGFPDNLPEDIRQVETKNGPEFNRYYFNDFYNRLRSSFIISRPNKIIVKYLLVTLVIVTISAVLGLLIFKSTLSTNNNSEKYISVNTAEDSIYTRYDLLKDTDIYTNREKKLSLNDTSNDSSFRDNQKISKETNISIQNEISSLVSEFNQQVVDYNNAMWTLFNDNPYLVPTSTDRKPVHEDNVLAYSDCMTYKGKLNLNGIPFSTTRVGQAALVDVNLYGPNAGVDLFSISCYDHPLNTDIDPMEIGPLLGFKNKLYENHGSYGYDKIIYKKGRIYLCVLNSCGSGGNYPTIYFSINPEDFKAL